MLLVCSRLKSLDQIELIFRLPHQRSKEHHNKIIHCSSLNILIVIWKKIMALKQSTALPCSISPRTVSAVPFVFRLRFTNWYRTLSVLLSSFIVLNLIFWFANRTHVLSVLSPSIIGLNLIFLFANRRCVFFIMLPSFFGLNFFLLFAHRRQVLSVILTSLIGQSFLLLFANGGDSFSVLFTSFCNLNLVFFSRTNVMRSLVFTQVMCLNLIFTRAHRSHVLSALLTSLVSLNPVLLSTLRC